MTQEQIFTTGSVRLNYLDYGASSLPPLVMLHGGAWRWQEYLSLIPALAQRRHVQALDLRGNGRSGWTPEAYRLLDFCKDGCAFLDRLESPAVIVGHSIGGVIALMMAAQVPDKVTGLIIEDAALGLETYRRIIDASRDMFSLWLDLKRSAASEQELALNLAEAYQRYPTVTSAWIMFFAGCLWQLDPTFFDTLLWDFPAFSQGYDYREILAELECPLLYLYGEAKLGAVTTDEEIAWLRQNVREIRCVRIDGTGHLLHLEDHGQAPVLAEMTSFLDCTPLTTVHAAT